jgi:small GTP-binding protein
LTTDLAGRAIWTVVVLRWYSGTRPSHHPKRRPESTLSEATTKPTPFVEGTARHGFRVDPRGYAASPTGRLFAIATPGGLETYSWGARGAELNSQDGPGRQKRLSHGLTFHSVTFDATGAYLIGASASEIRIYEVRDPSPGPQAVLQGHAGEIVALATTHQVNGRQLLISGGHDGNALLWDLKRRRQILRIDAFNAPVEAVAFTADDRLAIVGSGIDGVNLFMVDQDGKRSQVTEIPGGVSCLAVDAENVMFAVGTHTGAVEVRMVGQWRYAMALEGHTSTVSAVFFTTDGRFLVSRGRDDTIRAWDTRTWEPVFTVSDPASIARPYMRGALDPKTERFVTTGPDSDLVVWNLDLDRARIAPRSRGAVRYVTKRVALVGDSGVGKTSLGYRLVHGVFRPQESTHGQQFWPLDSLSDVQEDNARVEVVLWDFAGQPEYRIVHSLFLEDIDCALVLFDAANQDEPLSGVEYWLRQLSGAEATLPPAILVGARGDRGTPAMTKDEIEEFCERSGIADFHQTSAKTGEGVDALVESIRARLAERSSPITVTSEAFHAIKSFVIRLKSDEGGRTLLLPVNGLSKLPGVDNHEFDAKVVVTALRALRNHGYVELLEDSSARQFVLLQPETMIGLASSIILEARRNPRGLGALSEAGVLGGRYSFAEIAGRTAEERHVMLDSAVSLFIKHNVCFRETVGAETYIVFPSLINQGRPAVPRASMHDSVTYRVSGAVENVFAALVVLLGYTNTFRRIEQWRDQAEYEMVPNQICGFRQVSARAGEIELVLYYGEETSDSARMLFQGLFEGILRRRSVRIERYSQVDCPQCGYAQERSTVVRRLAAGRGFVNCEECGLRIALEQPTELLPLTVHAQQTVDEETIVTRKRTAYQAALVRVKALVRDRGLAQPTCFVSYAWESQEHSQWVEQLAIDLADAGIDVLLDVWDNSRVGSSVPRFIARIEQARCVVVVGSRTYRKKYFSSEAEGTMVAAEMDLIGNRLTGDESQKSTIFPVLSNGTPPTSFPPQLQGRVYADFSRRERYFGALFGLVLSLYGLPSRDPAVIYARQIMGDRVFADVSDFSEQELRGRTAAEHNSARRARLDPS